MIRVAVIGCGKIAQVRHLPEYATNPNAQLVAYYDKNSQRAHEVAAQYGGKVYDSYFDLLKDPEIDAVSVCVENRSHAEMTTAALYAGKHVLCEKPMAVTLAECESMVAAAEFNNRHLMIGHNMRFDPVHRRAKELLEQGVIGDVITFRTGLGTSGPEGWSMEGNWFFDKKKAVMGALSDLGIHKIDLMQYLTGQTVIETTAKILTLNKHDREDHLIGVDDNALCILRMNGGSAGTMAASWTVYGQESNSMPPAHRTPPPAYHRPPFSPCSAVRSSIPPFLSALPLQVRLYCTRPAALWQVLTSRWLRRTCQTAPKSASSGWASSAPCTG